MTPKVTSNLGKRKRDSNQKYKVTYPSPLYRPNQHHQSKEIHNKTQQTMCNKNPLGFDGFHFRKLLIYICIKFLVIRIKNTCY